MMNNLSFFFICVMFVIFIYIYIDNYIFRVGSFTKVYIERLQG